MNSRISAYIPCHNNAQTIKRCIQSIREQSIQVSELFVISDGSSDESVEVVTSLGVDLIELKKNYGRGYVRAKAMEHAKYDYVLCCDATLTLEQDFIKKALIHFSSENVGAVFGKVRLKVKHTAIDRWRSIYLFKEKEPPHLLHNISLLTGGAILKKEATLKIGNYDQTLRRSEDHDLGLRLNNSGINTISDSGITIWSFESNSILKTMERYWRWNHSETFTLKEYIQALIFSIRHMIKEDFKDRDFPRLFISLFYPHCMLFCHFYYSIVR